MIITASDGASQSLAFLDESYRDTGTERIALLSCVLVRTGSAQDVRDVVLSLVRGKRPRLHWREEGRRRQLEIASAVGATSVSALTWWKPLESGKHQERGRHLLLKAAVYALDRLGVPDVLVESRQTNRDAKDEEALAGFARQGVITTAMRVRHGRPTDEPLLWLPDVVAGAVGNMCCGRPEAHARLEHLSQVIEVPR